MKTKTKNPNTRGSVMMLLGFLLVVVAIAVIVGAVLVALNVVTTDSFYILGSNTSRALIAAANAAGV